MQTGLVDRLDYRMDGIGETPPRGGPESPGRAESDSPPVQGVNAVKEEIALDLGSAATGEKDRWDGAALKRSEGPAGLRGPAGT